MIESIISMYEKWKAHISIGDKAYWVFERIAEQQGIQEKLVEKLKFR